MGGRNQRDREDGHENWLLIKEKDETAVPGSGDALVEQYPDSVASGLSLEEIAADPERVWQSNRAEKTASFKDKLAAKVAKAAAKKAPAKKAAKKTAKPEPSATAAAIPGARKASMPSAIEPQLATLVEEVPQGDEWIHEIKYDGYRALCEVRDGEARLITRHGKDWTDRFAPVAREAEKLPVSQAILDGEVVVLEPDGTTSFQTLQNALAENRQDDLVYFAFDLLYLDGYDLRKSPLLARKEALDELLAGRAGAIRMGDHVETDGEGFYRQACTFALEGIVCKRGDLPYHSGRGKDWLKVKCLKRQEFAIVGFTDPEKSRVGFGALLLAVNDGKGDLVFAGKVGTGFNDRTLRELRARMNKLEVDKPAFKNPPRGAEARRSHWLKPQLVGEVAFTEWTREGILRHPTFQGLREDKSPREIVREEPQAPPPEAQGKKAEAKRPAAKAPAKRAPANKAAAKKGKKIVKGPKPPLPPAPSEVAVRAQGRSKKREVEIA